MLIDLTRACTIFIGSDKCCLRPVCVGMARGFAVAPSVLQQPHSATPLTRISQHLDTPPPFRLIPPFLLHTLSSHRRHQQPQYAASRASERVLLRAFQLSARQTPSLCSEPPLPSSFALSPLLSTPQPPSTSWPTWTPTTATTATTKVRQHRIRISSCLEHPRMPRQRHYSSVPQHARSFDVSSPTDEPNG